MKPETTIRHLTCVVILIFTIALISCSDSNSHSYSSPNQGIINLKDFYVSANSTELQTFTRGTVFLRDKEHNAQIIAWIEVDPHDWGGVEFAIPFAWEVTNITTSFPSGSVASNPQDYQILTVETGDQESSKWHQLVRIGTSDNQLPYGGGKGSIVIDLESDSKKSEALQILVGVGSEMRDGVRVLHPDSYLVEVPFVQ